MRRQPSAKDHRAKEVRLSDEGTALLQRLDMAGTDLWADVAGELTEDEVRQLINLTGRIIDIVRRRAGEPARREARRPPPPATS